jgi:hypothetical protein
MKEGPFSPKAWACSASAACSLVGVGLYTASCITPISCFPLKVKLHGASVALGLSADEIEKISNLIATDLG